MVTKSQVRAKGFEKNQDAIKNFSVGAVAFKAVSSAMNLVSQSMIKLLTGSIPCNDSLKS